MRIYIVYPNSNRKKLKLAEIENDIELNLYTVASRKNFHMDEINEAIDYCRELSVKHGLEYDGADTNGNYYLD